MCDACVLDVVTRRLGRRGAVAAVAAGLAGMQLGASPAAAQTIRSAAVTRVVDLTHALRPDFPTYGGMPAVAVEQTHALARDGYSMNRLTYLEHVGTHFDAPVHFSAGGSSVDAIPVETLVCPLVVLDVTERAAADPDYQLTPEDLAAHERTHGRVPRGACVALRSGWDAHVATPRFRNPTRRGRCASRASVPMSRRCCSSVASRAWWWTRCPSTMAARAISRSMSPGSAPGGGGWNARRTSVRCRPPGRRSSPARPGS
jgi:hypothetical protein